METMPLDSLLDELPTLTEEQIRVLHAAWAGGDVTVRRRAWAHGKRIVARLGAEAAQREAGEAVRRWVSDFATGAISVPYAMNPSFRDQDRLDLRIAAAPAILDAILATIVGEELAEDERDELLGPWLEATGSPAPIGDAWMAG
ncbi:MAG: hypothetical protein U0667_04870 [Chloroflexota bacterium]